MVDITHKTNSLRQATATAIVKVSHQDTIRAITEKTVPKGDVFEFSRAAGLLAIKKTSDVIPDCHPLPIEYSSIRYEVSGLDIVITVEVHTIYKTGVEVEAMHGASITALTIYDMLKPIDKGIEISTIRLATKKGGKTDFRANSGHSLKTGVIICSDSVTAGRAKDTSGPAIIEKLKAVHIDTALYETIPDDFALIQARARQLSEDGFRLAIFCGGTGLSKRDVTPDAIKPLLTKEISGIMESARSFGQQRTPFAMLSRGVAGLINDMLVITIPGSLKASEEYMTALFPYVLHIFQVIDGARHE